MESNNKIENLIGSTLNKRELGKNEQYIIQKVAFNDWYR